MVRKSIVIVGFAALYSLLLVACGEDSASDNPIWLNKNDYCKVISQKTQTLIIESVEEGFFCRTTLMYKEGRVTEEMEFESSSAVEKACPMYKMDSDYGEVKCEGKKIVAVSEETYSLSDFDRLKQSAISECENFNDEETSSSRESSSSSRIASCSSSRVESSSSSQVESSSESEEEPIRKSQDPNGYMAAYEFNDPENLGKDSFGLNDAVDINGTCVGDGENLVLDGSSGLKIPLSEEFMINGFFIEARIYPEEFSSIQNIFVSEPRGSGYSGWMLRLDNGVLKFLLRDRSSHSGSWPSYEVGRLPLDEWTSVRVEKYDSGEIVIFVNGSLVLTEQYSGSVINRDYDLGIGYSAVGQKDYGSRAFKGKIDYIRFGSLSEED